MSADPGLFEALRRVAGTAVAVFQSRLELAGLELSEARHRIFTAAVLGLFAVLLLVVGLVALSVCVVLLLWDRFGVLALAGMGLIYLLIGMALLMRLRHQIHSQPKIFEATAAELHRDALMLRGPTVARDS